MVSGDDQAEGNDESDAEVKKQDPWMKFLNNKDGELSLISWDDAIKLGLNKKNGWQPIREIVIQAWSEYIVIFSFGFYLILFIQIN